MLLKLIKSAQAGNQNDMLLLIQKFAPILKKYGGQLKREDGINDMILYFNSFSAGSGNYDLVPCNRLNPVC